MQGDYLVYYIIKEVLGVLMLWIRKRIFGELIVQLTSLQYTHSQFEDWLWKTKFWTEVEGDAYEKWANLQELPRLLKSMLKV